MMNKISRRSFLQAAGVVAAAAALTACGSADRLRRQDRGRQGQQPERQDPDHLLPVGPLHDERAYSVAGTEVPGV